MGTILAAAETLLSDEPVAGGLAKDIVDGLGLETAAEVERDHDECMGHLLSSFGPGWKSGSQKTIGEMFSMAVLSERSDVRGDQLPQLGIRVHPNNEHWQWVLVACRHQQLEGLFANTRWGGGVWAQAMRRLEGAVSGKDGARELGIGVTQKFAGRPARWVALPRWQVTDKPPPPPAPPDIDLPPVPTGAV